MIMRMTAVAAALACAASAIAQTAPAAPTGTAAPAPADPARLAAARPVVDRLWPLGTYQRIMSTRMESMMGGVLGGMFDLKADEVARASGDAKGRTPEQLRGKTLGDIVREEDPAFAERMRISMRVMMGELTKLMVEVEPEVRASLTDIVARRYSVAELAELQRFFATPTGGRFASDALLIMTEPDMIQSMTKLTPRFLEAMPVIQKKAEEATKHLPPPPKRKADAEDSSE